MDYPFPISVSCEMESCGRASLIDLERLVMEIQLDKLLLKSERTENGDNYGISISVNLNQGTPPNLNEEIERRLLLFWTQTSTLQNTNSNSNFKILEIFKYFEQNMFDLLTCIPSLIEMYEGVDEYGSSVRRYVILQPDLQTTWNLTTKENNEFKLQKKVIQENLIDEIENDDLRLIALWLKNSYDAKLYNDRKIVKENKEKKLLTSIRFELCLHPTDPAWPSKEEVDGLYLNGFIDNENQFEIQIQHEKNKQISETLVKVLQKAVGNLQEESQNNQLKSTLNFLENYAGQFYEMVKELEHRNQSGGSNQEESDEDNSSSEVSSEDRICDDREDYSDYSSDEQQNGEEVDSDLQNEESQPATNVEGQQRRFILQLSNLKLDNIDAIQCLQLQLQIVCERCGQGWPLKFNSSAVDSSSKTSSSNSNSVVISDDCPHCHRSTSVGCQFKLIHEFNDSIASLTCVACFPVDWLPSMLSVQCTECGQQFALRDVQVGQSAFKDCRSCYKKCEVQFASIQFNLIKESNSQRKQQKKKSAVKTSSKGSKKPPQFNGALKVGQPLPATGTCKHYQHSHKWYRFPCCGQRFPCDLCHEEHTDGHDIKWANRLVCGFCSMEQSLTKTCVNCNKRLATGASHPSGRNTRFWEGGKGCRDPRRMHGKDPHKYKNSKFKTKSKKQTRVGQEGAIRRQRALERRDDET
eukprot:TRINITY_DN5453_c0_g1_i5.p1 TRINITY_DN5453_c0_g1~~TRINITY_DN5453_c0_g1_i5.p1  ORF type:complete len:807 (-),score=134.73 TRINITY_DN5453_c0_g1_i5:335-2419(-)